MKSDLLSPRPLHITDPLAFKDHYQKQLTKNTKNKKFIHKKNLNMREAMLILHFIGLTMGLGTSFAHAFLGIVTSKMTTEEATKFRLHSLVLSKMGNIGIVLLVFSGLYLISPYWGTLLSLPLLMLKLALVIILVVLITLINLSAKKAMKGEAEVQLKKMEPLGKMTLIIGVVIVILAVYIFH